MQNYAKGKPVGNNQIPFYDSPPPVLAIARTIKETGVGTSSILVLTDDTTAIEVVAMGGTAFIKWLAQSTVDGSVAGSSIIATGATANYDHAIPNATVKRFVVPISASNNVTVGAVSTSMVGANVENRLFKNVAFVGTAASVIGITQYGSSNSY